MTRRYISVHISAPGHEEGRCPCLLDTAPDLLLWSCAEGGI
jgi:hypothetical protein